jgi:hypothetical protein
MKYIILIVIALSTGVLQAQYAVEKDPNTLKFGARDNKGTLVIPYMYSFLEYSFLDQFVANKCDNSGTICSEGVINSKNEIIVPFEYSMITYDNEYYMLYLGCELNEYTGDCTGGALGFANSSGKIVIPCIYDNDSELWWVDAFASNYNRLYSSTYREGLFNVSLNDKWGYVDVNNNVIIPFQYGTATNFYQDSALVFLNEKEFFIDKKGRCIKNCPDVLDSQSTTDYSDQTANYEYVINQMMNLYVDDYNKYAGEEMMKRENELYDRIVDEIQLVLNYGTQEQKKVIRYMYFVICRNRAANEKYAENGLVYLQKVSSFAGSFTPSDFPISFQYAGKGRSYSYESYKTSYEDYIVRLAENEYLTNDVNSVRDLKKAIEITTVPFQKAGLSGYLIDYKQKNKEYDQEILTLSNDLLAQYILLNETEKYRMDTLKLWSGNEPAAVEAGFTARSSEKVPNNFYVTGYKNYQTLGRTESAEYFMKKAYEGGYEETEFLYSYAALMKTKGDLNTGNKIADKLAIRATTTDCSSLQRIAELYSSLDNMSAAKEYKSKADDCNEEVLKAQKKAARQSNRGGSSYSYDKVDGGIFFGADVLPMIRIDDAKRDYGFKMDIIGRNIAHEFGYSIQNNNRDYMWDLSMRSDESIDANEEVRWNGYVAMYSLKFLTDEDESAFFVGPTFRYRYKDFGVIDTTVTDLNFLTTQEIAFNPTEKQYELLLNYGYQTVKPGFAAEFYFGFGPKYSVFNVDSPYYNSDEWTVSHSLLEYRQPTRWGVGMRVGFTIGFKIF